MHLRLGQMDSRWLILMLKNQSTLEQLHYSGERIYGCINTEV